MNDKKRLELLNEQLGTSYESFDDVDWTYIGDVDWNYISAFHVLSEDFIREFKDIVVWCYISQYQKLSEEFIREFKDDVNWRYVSQYQKLSEEFIREFKDDVNWRYVSKYQKLSESFISEFKNKVNWICISKYQKLSEDFIRDFKDMVYWSNVSKYQKLSDNFIKDFGHELDQCSIVDNWIYIGTGFLKKRVESTGLYECHDDYFIAYKGIRSDRYSAWNFQYQYLPGESYESFCDCSPDETSFGLSVWTEDQARKYCNELVVKVKVKYEDVGRVVYNGGKVRCRRITIMN